MSKDKSNLMMDKMWIKSKRRTFENCYFFAMTISLTSFLIVVIGKMMKDDLSGVVMKIGAAEVLMVFLMVVFVKLGACCKWKQDLIVFMVNIVDMVYMFLGIPQLIAFIFAIIEVVKDQQDGDLYILFMSTFAPWIFSTYFDYVTFNTDTYNLHGLNTIEAPKTKSKSGGPGLNNASATSSYGSTSQIPKV